MRWKIKYASFLVENNILFAFFSPYSTKHMLNLYCFKYSLEVLCFFSRQLLEESLSKLIKLYQRGFIVDYSVLIMMVTKMVLPEHLKLRLYGPTGFPMMTFEKYSKLLFGWKHRKVICNMHEMLEMVLLVIISTFE